MSENIILKDLSYGEHERQRFDLFIPEKPLSDSGIILYIHGGGWSDGDKSIHTIDAEYMCNNGYISAAVNYRFVTDTLNVFDELDDITAALTEIKAVLSKYGKNAEKLILSGGSAGAHLALLYAYTREDEASVMPVAVCAYCPPVDCAADDFLLGISGEFEDWKYSVLSKCCGVTVNKSGLHSEIQQKALKRMSPMMYIKPSCVPTAVFYAMRDELIPPEHVKRFLKLLDENGIHNDYLIYENSGHALDKDPDAVNKSREIITDYAKRYF